MLVAVGIALKLLAIILLMRIAWIDFSEQRISNRDVLILLGAGAGALAIGWLAGGSLWCLGVGVVAGLLLFCVLIPFWLLRKVGAGDVKLLAVAPITTGGDDLFLFSLLLLVAAAITAFVVTNPLILPEGLFRRYVLLLDRKGVVPFGVPIAASLVVVVVLQIVRELTAPV